MKFDEIVSRSGISLASLHWSVVAVWQDTNKQRNLNITKSII